MNNRLENAPSPLSAKEAIGGRRSVRRFLPAAVDVSVIQTILTEASRAPSGTNIQPWRVHVVIGAARDRLASAAAQAVRTGDAQAEYAYLPDPLREPYRSRRRKIGFDLYALYGIDRHDMPAREAAMLRNFDFFGAPVGLFFTMERDLALGSWLDCGMFMQNVMILARTHGLETCAQQAWCDIGSVVHQALSIDASEIIMSGMAIGLPDRTAPENRLVTEREPLESFVQWHSG